MFFGLNFLNLPGTVPAELSSSASSRHDSEDSKRAWLISKGKVFRSFWHRVSVKKWKILVVCRWNEKMRSEDEQRVERSWTWSTSISVVFAAQMKITFSIQPRHSVLSGGLAIKETDNMILLHPDRVCYDQLPKVNLQTRLDVEGNEHGAWTAGFLFSWALRSSLLLFLLKLYTLSLVTFFFFICWIFFFKDKSLQSIG